MDRRDAMKTDDSTASFTPSLSEAAATAAQLLTDLSTDEQPRQILSRVLSSKAVGSTTSSFAIQNQEARFVEEPKTFRRIGAGTCGTVFQRIGFPYIAKKEKSGVPELWNDMIMHARVLEALKASPVSIDTCVPKCLGYISSISAEWWSLNLHNFPKDHQQPSNILLSERILPLPRIARDALIDLYFPKAQPAHRREAAKQDQANRDCLARVYIGKRRDPSRRPPQFFSLNNFNLHVDQMEDLDVDIDALAESMADALALMHWAAKIDADDVEFVLGSASTQITIKCPTVAEIRKLPAKTTTFTPGELKFLQRLIHLWLLDFNKCKSLSMDQAGIETAAKAFYKNDPYYPRPLAEDVRDRKLWKIFQERYMMTSAKFGQAELGEGFIKELVKMRQLQLEERERDGFGA